MADISKDGLLLGGGIRHNTATQAKVKKFLFHILNKSHNINNCSHDTGD